jgi:hypothetical protein
MVAKLVVVAALGAALCHPAFAQSTAQPIDKIPEKTAPNSDPPKTDLSKQGGNLSDKLNATDGVIHPEGAVDPNMQKPAPSTGSMPVIHPPGSPGGAPNVEPK